MPYLPPADLPPPPIVRTVQTVAVTPDGVGTSSPIEQQATTSVSGASAHQSSARDRSLVPEPTVQQAQFSNGTPVHAERVISLPHPETRAEFLHALPPAAVSTYSTIRPLPLSAVETNATRSTSRAQRQFLPSLSLPWMAQRRDRSEAEQNTEFSDETAEDSHERNAPASDAESATDSNANNDDDASASDEEPVYPRAATPERDWSNGAVVNGTLLPPTQPTNQPPTPLNLVADYQEFEPQTQVLTARGDVILRLGNGVIQADRLWANLANRFVIVEGDVIFTRGEQVVEADRGEYNLVQGSGSLFDARGTLFLPRTGTDFDVLSPAETSNSSVLDNDPITNVRGTGGITFGTGIAAPSGTSDLPQADSGGAVRRFRFEAVQLDFDSEGWYAQDISLTNDPFSPPELVFQGDSATLTRLTEVQDELFVENARLVFDQSFTVPLLRDRVLLNRGEQSENPLFVTIGIDGEDRDGLFVERSFQVFNSGPWRAFITPQFLAQRFIAGEDNPPEDTSFLRDFGLEADVIGSLGPKTGVRFNASFSGLDFQNIEERLRSSVRVRQLIGDHSLNLEYSYRDRLFNGSLGFQTVQSNLGVVLLSPSIELGDTGIFVNYQASAQLINANTDRLDLADSSSPPFRATLGRFQGSVGLGRTFTLWRGEPLPATPDEGLRFTSTQRVPNIRLILSGRGTYTYYTSDDTQDDLSASIGLRGELGHFSRDFLDSTVFNLTYTRSFVSDAATSPFLFDRNVDRTRLSGGIIQQIYGPFRLGFQTSVNLDTGEVISTDYILEYNRRTYGIFLRYNPTQESGFVGFRLNEFDWSGRASRFGGADIRQVEGGIVR